MKENPITKNVTKKLQELERRFQMELYRRWKESRHRTALVFRYALLPFPQLQASIQSCQTSEAAYTTFPDGNTDFYAQACCWLSSFWVYFSAFRLCTASA